MYSRLFREAPVGKEASDQSCATVWRGASVGEVLGRTVEDNMSHFNSQTNNLIKST
jgi:hypothetical protein